MDSIKDKFGLSKGIQSITNEPKLSRKDIQHCIKQGINKAYQNTSNPCVSKIEIELLLAIDEKINSLK